MLLNQLYLFAIYLFCVDDAKIQNGFQKEKESSIKHFETAQSGDMGKGTKFPAILSIPTLWQGFCHVRGALY